MSLFYRFHYWVVLADGGFLVEPSAVASGHVFDPFSKKIAELEHLGHP